MFKMSLADSFGIALAQRLSAEFVSCDYHELDILNRSGTIQVTFIRPKPSPKEDRDRLHQRLIDTLEKLEALDVGSIPEICDDERRALLNAIRNALG